MKSLYGPTPLNSYIVPTDYVQLKTSVGPISNGTFQIKASRTWAFCTNATIIELLSSNFATHRQLYLDYDASRG